MSEKLKAPERKVLKVCHWSYDIDSDAWDTDCKGKFSLTNDTPLENHMKFCCYCGKKLKEVLP